MSCFWDSILKKLNKNDLQKYKIHNNLELVTFLKEKNIKTDNVVWNNQKLSEKQKQENKQHIQSYQTNTISQGYLCSTCDPFLLLLSELFEITIQNNYNGNKIIYSHKTNNKYTIQLNNNSSHMS
tara:strand:- start:211 stop:585 length:375 start_codon:yes stop_codon:yes gene_type:complete